MLFSARHSDLRWGGASSICFPKPRAARWGSYLERTRARGPRCTRDFPNARWPANVRAGQMQQLPGELCAPIYATSAHVNGVSCALRARVAWSCDSSRFCALSRAGESRLAKSASYIKLSLYAPSPPRLSSCHPPPCRMATWTCRRPENFG